jgi:hypothetical protein
MGPQKFHSQQGQNTIGGACRTKHNVVEREARDSTPRSPKVLRIVTTPPDIDESYPFTSNVPETKNQLSSCGDHPREKKRLRKSHNNPWPIGFLFKLDSC